LAFYINKNKLSENFVYTKNSAKNIIFFKWVVAEYCKYFLHGSGIAKIPETIRKPNVLHQNNIPFVVGEDFFIVFLLRI